MTVALPKAIILEFLALFDQIGMVYFHYWCEPSNASKIWMSGSIEPLPITCLKSPLDVPHPIYVDFSYFRVIQKIKRIMYMDVFHADFSRCFLRGMRKNRFC